jgi:glutamate 5-kinase
MDEREARRRFAAEKRWVVKVGSALLTADGAGLDRSAIGEWARQIAALRAAGHEVLLVSSGAVAEGVTRLGLARRPNTVHELQAAAAVGQMGLSEAWENALQAFGIRTALALLTHDDLSNRRRYLNARTTLLTLLRYGVVPVINENDTVVTDEIRFGDNDTLAALVTNLVEAGGLVLLTDQAGLFDADPRERPAASLVGYARANDPALTAMAGAGTGAYGRGGMSTKLGAARIAARSGAGTLIASGRVRDVLLRAQAGETIGSLLAADVEPMLARKRWIAGQLKNRGEVVLDAGAVRVLREAGRSLLPVGVRESRGSYARGDVVLCLDPEGRPVAKGLVNYDSEETARILGCATRDIEARLGYVNEPELIHRDNLVLL